MRWLIGLIAAFSFGSQACAELVIFDAEKDARQTLTIYSSTDTERLVTIIDAFQRLHPDVRIAYHLLDTREIYKRATAEIDDGKPGADLLLSSAMDLQVKLVNDGYATTYRSAAMIDKVASGEALIAYNVLGSYARARARDNPDLGITIPRDYCLVMSRIAVITRTARNPRAAGWFIDFLLSRPGQQLIANAASLYSLRNDIQGAATAARLRQEAQGPLIPIHLGPGLLVYLDKLKRQDFLARWRRAMARE